MNWAKFSVASAVASRHAVLASEIVLDAGEATELTVTADSIRHMQTDITTSEPSVSCTSANAGKMYFDTAHTIIFVCDGTTWQPFYGGATAAVAGSVNKPLTDCSEAPLTGLYYVQAGSDSVQVYCDDGFALAAVISNADASNWASTDANGNLGDSNSLWQNAATFGSLTEQSATTNQDLKTAAFNKYMESGRPLNIRIKYKDKLLLETSGGCVPTGSSLRDYFDQLTYSCGGGEGLSGGNNACTHSCTISRGDASLGEPCLFVAKSTMPSHLYLKAGEAEGAQDGNKDRSYFSTSHRTNVDAPSGLGSFCQRGSDVSTDMGIQDDGSVAPSDSSIYYSVWVGNLNVLPITSCVGQLSGIHQAQLPSGVTTQVYCQDDWMLAAVVANGDGSNWIYTDASGDAGDPNGLWQSDSTLGQVSKDTATTNADFKSPVFNDYKGSGAVKIMYKTTDLVLTSAGCLQSKSLRDRFRALKWDCEGSASLAGNACAHACDVASGTAVGDPAVSHGATSVPSQLYFKAGEKEGVQDGNKDRSYLSTSHRTGVDAPSGLGSFAAIGTIHQADMGISHDAAVAPSDTSIYYSVWVK